MRKKRMIAQIEGNYEMLTEEAWAIRLVHAMWALAERGDEDAKMLTAQDVNIVWLAAQNIAAGEGDTEFSSRVHAEAIAMRLEGK